MDGEDANEYIASDVYRVWKKRVQSAESTVWVFTPYLDRMLARLVSNSQLAPEKIIVITDLSPESGAVNYRKKLLTLSSLMESGIRVKTLGRLHAKVLVVDGRFATVGSQNFTTYARHSREATAVPARDLSQARFVGILRSWIDAAEDVEPRLLQELLENLSEPILEFEESYKMLAHAYAEQVATWIKKRETEHRLQQQKEARLRDQASLARAISRTVKRSGYRSPQGVAYARVEWVPSSDWHEEEHQSLVVDRDNDLTKWYQPGDRGILELKRLWYYPVLLLPQGRMAFARIGRTRITYVKDGVRFTTRRTFSGHDCYVRLSFPDPSTSAGNITLTLSGNSEIEIGYRFDLRFDGGNVVIAGEDSVGPTSNQWAPRLKEAGHGALRETGEAVRFLGELLRPVKFDKVGLGDYNANRFFESGVVYRIDLFDVGESHVIVAHRG